MIVRQHLGLLGCAEWAILKGRLDLLVSQAETLGLNGSGYAAAKQYYDANTGFFSRPAVLIGDACSTEVNEINSRIAGLTSEIRSRGATPTVEGPAIEPSAGPWADLSSTVKWIIGGAIAISAAVVVANVVPRLWGKKK